jgi:predicted transcriptional regulator
VNLAPRFRHWRETHKHISQVEFARALGVSRDTVNSIEMGRRRAGRKTIQKFKELVDRHRKAVPIDTRSWKGK